MMDAAIFGMGRWGQTLVKSVQGKSDTLRFVAGITRSPDKYQDFAKEAGRLPQYALVGDWGLDNGFGWSVQGFIEGVSGELRTLTYEENLFCMGCHTLTDISRDFAGVELSPEETAGHRIVKSQVTFYGICLDCQDS